MCVECVYWETADCPPDDIIDAQKFQGDVPWVGVTSQSESMNFFLSEWLSWAHDFAATLSARFLWHPLIYKGSQSQHTQLVPWLAQAANLGYKFVDRIIPLTPAPPRRH